ncbi:MAG TPA: VCBS repeat-containing protein [Terracidiphilus sp.]|nr:VCBS repeat-containing protein [Terracidiphilus sp.]
MTATASAAAAGRGTARVAALDNADESILLPMWSDGAGWGSPQYYETLHAAPLLGNPKQQQLLIRSPLGILAQTFNPDFGYWVQLPDGPTLTDADYWDQPQYYSTIQSADINGDGCTELIARGGDGVVAWAFNQSQQAWNMLPSSGAWSDANGGTNVWTYQSICSGDINGDGRDELVTAVLGTGAMLTIDAWGYNPETQSWYQLPSPSTIGFEFLSLPQYYETLACEDIDGDGVAEVLIRLGTGLAVLSFDAKAQSWSRGSDLGAMSDANGWNAAYTYGTICYGNILGVKGVEVVGRRSDGTVVAYRFDKGQNHWVAAAYDNSGPGNPPQLTGVDWLLPAYYKTLQLADIDGDGRAELLVRLPTGYVFWRYGDGSWSNQQPATAFTDAQGWNGPAYYPTIRFVDVNGDGCAEALGRGYAGLWTLQWANNGWTNACGGKSQFPQYSGDEQDAYISISQQLTQYLTPTSNIRSTYGLESTDFDTLLADLSNQVTCPSTIQSTVWQPVFQQIDMELNKMSAVNMWFSLVRNCLGQTFNSESLTVSSVQNLVQMSTKDSNLDVIFDVLSVVADIAWAVIGMMPGLMGGGDEVQNDYDDEPQLQDAGSVGIAAGAAGMISATFSAATISNGGGQDTSISTTVGEIQYNLGNWYTNIKKSIDTYQAKVATDWGLIQSIASGPAWPVGLSDAISAVAVQGYNLYLFQTLMPLHWYVVQWKENNVPLSGYPGQYSLWQGGQEYWLADGVDVNSASYPNDTLFQILFTTGTGNLGASVSDVLLGNNGWSIPSAAARGY